MDNSEFNKRLDEIFSDPDLTTGQKIYAGYELLFSQTLKIFAKESIFKDEKLS